jgi:hypothetical protein
MFLPPLLALPFVLTMAVYRLYRLPRLLCAGELQVNSGNRSSLLVLTVIAYIGLFSYTIGIAVVVVRTLLQSHASYSALLPAIYLIAGYPFVYIGAEWVFFYGIKPTNRSMP